MDYTFLSRNSDGHCLLQEDHINAKWLARELVARLPGLKISNNVETNMVFVDVRGICGMKMIGVNVRSHH